MVVIARIATCSISSRVTPDCKAFLVAEWSAPSWRKPTDIASLTSLRVFYQRPGFVAGFAKLGEGLPHRRVPLFKCRYRIWQRFLHRITSGRTIRRTTQRIAVPLLSAMKGLCNIVMACCG